MGRQKSFLQGKLKDWTRDITSLANPIILVLVPFIFLGSSKVFFTLLIALLVNEIFASLIKVIYPKKRPTGQTYSTILEKIDAGSFPSIHASRITLAYLTIFSNTNSTGIKIAVLSVIILVILSRILLKKHYWIDVIGGFILGLTIWVLFFNL